MVKEAVSSSRLKLVRWRYVETASQVEENYSRELE